MSEDTPGDNIRLGVSSCLLGELVRYDGGERKHRYVTSVLRDFCEWVAVCPEVELGMGIPREPIQIVGGESTPRLVSVETREDWTQAMNRWSHSKAGELAEKGIDGYIFKSKSPSCGVGDTPVHSASGAVTGNGDGFWAATFRRQLGHLPMTTESRLDCIEARLRFLELVAAARWLRTDPARADAVIRRAIELRSPGSAADSRNLAACFARPVPRIRVEASLGVLLGKDRALLLRSRS